MPSFAKDVARETEVYASAVQFLRQCDKLCVVPVIP